MLTIRYQTTFKKDYKTAKKRGYDLRLIEEVIRMLAEGRELPKKYKDHILLGSKYKGCHECHITPDWLLVYQIGERGLILYLTRTGTHSDIF